MMIAAEAWKSFKKKASSHLPQQEVKRAWLEQLASEQHLICINLSISLDNIMVKYAAFQTMAELYQSSFLENILQTSLANRAQSLSSFRKSFPRMKEHQLHQQEPAFGRQAPRASIGACTRACKKAAYSTAHRRSRRSSLTRNFCSKSSGASAFLQGPSGRMDCSFHS